MDVVLGSNSGATVALGTSTEGTFDFFPRAIHTTAVAVADFNIDSVPDIVTLNSDKFACIDPCVLYDSYAYPRVLILNMKSVVHVEINAPHSEVAVLFADPRNNPKWMHDLDRCEPVSGELGMPGSMYRLVPKSGNMAFVATVISRDLPHELRLHFDHANVEVAITGRLKALSPTSTELVSEEVFTFKGILNAIFSIFAWKTIRTVHHQHIEDFKRFVEGVKRS